jgi:tripartite-type tricarboxylate transporter receptor subunit TctC
MSELKEHAMKSPRIGNGHFDCKIGVEFLRAVSLTLAFLTASVAQGLCQDRAFPARTITIVHPYPSGGLGADLARLVADRLEREFISPVIVETRPGGNALVGSMSVVRSAADGHTLLINSTSVIGSVRSIYATPAYAPLTDLSLLAVVASVPMVLVANTNLAINSLQDMAALAKSRVGGLSFGTIGVGSAQHLNMEFVKRTLGVEFTHVPYRGINLGLNDVVAGHIALMFTDIASALPLIEAGKLRPIGVTSAKRVEVLPDVPSLSEIGLPGFDMGLLLAFYVPAKTPASTIALLNGKIHELGKEPALRKRYSAQGIELIASPGPDELRTLFAREVARWSRLVEDAGLAGSQ